MIIVLKPNTSDKDIARVEHQIKRNGLDTHIVRGQEMTIIGCIGDTTRLDARLFEVDASVDKVMHVQEPYKLANRAFHPEDSIIDVSGVKVGGDHLALIAGPCSVESYEQVLGIAKSVKAAGANMLRGGAFKPRTSPYSFQGLGLEGLEILCAVRRRNRTSNCNRTDVSRSSGHLQRKGRPDSDWCAQHAEFRPAQAIRAAGPPDSFKAWIECHL